jgi:hypothetical protein
MASPPCDHSRLDIWIDSPGDERDGYGCLSCGRWFETEADAQRDAESQSDADAYHDAESHE